MVQPVRPAPARAPRPGPTPPGPERGGTVRRTRRPARPHAGLEERPPRGGRSVRLRLRDGRRDVRGGPAWGAGLGSGGGLEGEDPGSLEICISDVDSAIAPDNREAR
ncbi:hypothetical protein THAOC_06729 [Thalassiosira oceanica]|uniref:Uncharacterized protein n=1 Tax=Thalassiosira oceanica TaxID=159749 RepID=K0TLE5_THAOC|nr:hypothetical protein THAOC_06729 [Thalassiosira oceanica]|eukprot:EJK71797.1 hypothetical protein THAOC_06729 [Thalassiosira oceanica]